MKDPQIFRFLLSFWVLTLAVWSYRTYRLLVTLRKTPRLGPASPDSQNGLVSIIIPAKNEERNIGDCIAALERQTYPNCEIIVINDNSTDRTESILKAAGARYFNCPPAPEGWTGKNHALHYGVSHAKGRWLLFTDADTRHEPHSVASSLTYAKHESLELLSLLPHCLTGSFIERVVQPPAMAFLGLWFPMEKVNDPASPLYFANGQYLLIRRRLYEKLGGHQAVAGAFLEDFALMHLAKQSGAKARCAFGTDLYGTRMYDSFDGIWRGWRRIYLHAFRKNVFVLLQKALGVFCFSVLPIVLFLWLLETGFLNSGVVALLSIVTLGIIGTICWQSAAAVRTKGHYAFLHPFAAGIVTLILLDALRMVLTGEKTHWR